MAFVLTIVLVLILVISHVFFQLGKVSIGAISAALLILFYISSRRFTVCETSLTFDRNKISILRDGQHKSFSVNEISSYKINYMSGARIDMKLTGGTKVVLVGSDYFNKWEPLKQFCIDFDEYVRSISNGMEPMTLPDEASRMVPVPSKGEKTDDKIFPSHVQATSGVIEPVNHGCTIPRRDKSFYEKKYALPLLLMFSVLTIGILLYIYVVDKRRTNGPMIMGVTGLMAMWVSYLKHAK